MFIGFINANRGNIMRNFNDMWENISERVGGVNGIFETLARTFRFIHSFLRSFISRMGGLGNTLETIAKIWAGFHFINISAQILGLAASFGVLLGVILAFLPKILATAGAFAAIAYSVLGVQHMIGQHRRSVALQSQASISASRRAMFFRGQLDREDLTDDERVRINTQLLDALADVQRFGATLNNVALKENEQLRERVKSLPNIYTLSFNPYTGRPIDNTQQMRNAITRNETRREVLLDLASYLAGYDESAIDMHEQQTWMERLNSTMGDIGDTLDMTRGFFGDIDLVEIIKGIPSDIEQAVEAFNQEVEIPITVNQTVTPSGTQTTVTAGRGNQQRTATWNADLTREQRQNSQLHFNFSGVRH
jgi:hypothetical protein